MFDRPGLQIQKAAHQKVARQLEKLFLKYHTPYEITHLIADYLLAAPNCEI